MVVSELRGEKIDIIPWNSEPARFVAKALSPARVREVLVDDDANDATVVVPDDQLSLAIGKEGLNARLAARLTGWKIDITSETDFAKSEAEAVFGGDEEEFSGRCAAVLSTGKRCPNSALPGSRYCGIPAHRALADQDGEAPAADEPAQISAEGASNGDPVQADLPSEELAQPLEADQTTPPVEDLEEAEESIQEDVVGDAAREAPAARTTGDSELENVETTTSVQIPPADDGSVGEPIPGAGELQSSDGQTDPASSGNTGEGESTP